MTSFKKMIHFVEQMVYSLTITNMIYLHSDWKMQKDMYTYINKK